MRALLQRVREAKVSVNGQTVGKTGPGLLVFLGIGQGDGQSELEWMLEKISTLRIFEDPQGKMNLSLADTHRSMLVVSQFTLYADTRKGRRPSFVDAAAPSEASLWIDLFCQKARLAGYSVETGVFGADMQVSLMNDGPVTIWLDSAQRSTAL